MISCVADAAITGHQFRLPVTCLRSMPELLPISSDIWLLSRAAARNCDINQYYGPPLFLLLPLLLSPTNLQMPHTENDAWHVSAKGLLSFLEL